MSRNTNPNRPRVFLSFAGDNRPSAMLLDKELEARRIDTFIDSRSIKVGSDIVLAINDNLTQSDYYVLLWSRHTVDRRWVEAEWAAALSRELDGRRSFLFTVRLDDTELPRILAPRKYLDFSGDWAAIADELVAAWSQDNALTVPVLPAPLLAHRNRDTRPTIALFVRNLDLAVAHVLRVHPDVAEDELEIQVREELALPTRTTTVGGAIELLFHYRLTHGGGPVPVLRDCAMLDLEVTMELRDLTGLVAKYNYRDSSMGKDSTAIRRAALRSAFGHLLPR